MSKMYCWPEVAKFIEGNEFSESCNIISPCGSGKSTIAAAIYEKHRGKRVMFTTIQTSVLSNLVRNAGVDVLAYSFGYLCRRLSDRDLPDVDVIVVDESHHVGLGTRFSEVLDYYISQGVLVFGLSASERYESEYFRSVGFKQYRTVEKKSNHSVVKRIVPTNVRIQRYRFSNEKEKMLYYVGIRRARSKEQMKAFLSDIQDGSFVGFELMEDGDGLILYSEHIDDMLIQKINECIGVTKRFVQGDSLEILDEYNRGDVKCLVAMNRLDEGVSIKRKTLFVSCYNKTSKIAKQQREGRLAHGAEHKYVEYTHK